MVYPSLTPSQSDQDFASTAQLLASSQTSSHQSDSSLEINSKSDVSSETNSQSNATTGSGDSRDAQKEVQKLSTQELFEKLKAEGNELVKQVMLFLARLFSKKTRGIVIASSSAVRVVLKP
ncbi:hypothetical protein DPMN_190995 [Dreissena polymorpha]|uniref:Uncharacterized protein n=1 Tax=Dreissena polymorpha TaxID=45954 RepID=A0A9D3Y0Z5_DREPO|nr:hypothetical protein DPMN_190995 [Dreissena polymorpha]